MRAAAVSTWIDRWLGPVPPPVPPPGALTMMAWLAALLAGAAGVVWLVGGYHAGFVALNGLAPSLPPVVWSLLTCLGDSAVALALFLCLARTNLGLCRVVLIACLLGLLWTHGFKQVMPQLRPIGVLEAGSFYSLGATKLSESFPSGHSQTAMTLAGIAVLCTRSRVWQALALALGFAAAASRVFVGVHWPVDVLAGAAGGLICVLLAVLIDRRLGPAGPLWVLLTLALCIVAAVMVTLGHPTDYPAAQPWLRAVGPAALLVFFAPLLRKVTARLPD